MIELLNVLLAEDNQGDVLLVREALKAHAIKHKLWVFPDGAVTINYLDRMGSSAEAPCPDIFLLDLNLPKVDGHELLNRVRQHPLCSTIPVIIVTSSDAPLDRERAIQSGAERFFRKPSDLDEFMRLGAVIREIMGNSLPQ